MVNKVLEGPLLPFVSRLICAAIPVALICVALSWNDLAYGGLHQTETLSIVESGATLPYGVSVRPYDFGAGSLPTLHSFASAIHDNQWVLMAGRTNGLHGFDQNPFSNFPDATQNQDVWVVDPVAKLSWHRRLDASSGLSDQQIRSLTPTNNQFFQQADRLYLSGGYGLDANGDFTTFETLTAVDLPGVVDWVKNGNGSASESIRQVQDPLFRVTGGAMNVLDGRTQLVFGQDFSEGYIFFGEGIYTEQVRSFEIVDDGQSLSIENVTLTEPFKEYRRRDLNVVPVIRPNLDGTLAEGLVAYSGVFTEAQGAWTVPVQLSSDGQLSMADATSETTFKQGMNNYQSATVGMFSRATGQMHQLMFGGISLQYVNDAGLIETDDAMPFVNDITSIVSDDTGRFSQFHLGHFPKVFDGDGNQLRFGTNAQFFPAAGIESYANGVLNLDAIKDETVIGFIFGGIASNAPHTRGVPNAVSIASNQIFEVIVSPVPEPDAAILYVVAFAVILRPRRWG